MKSHQIVKKQIDKILHTDDLSDASKLRLLKIKKNIEFGEVNFTNGLQNSQLLPFFKLRSRDISVWLNLPLSVTIKKIETNNFTEVEMKLILTNVFLGIYEDEKSTDE